MCYQTKITKKKEEMQRHFDARISGLDAFDPSEVIKAFDFPKTPVITDEGQVPKDAFQELGDGVINIPAIVRLAKEIGVEQCHVEQDQSPAPLESIVQSYSYLQGKA